MLTFGAHNLYRKSNCTEADVRPSRNTYITQFVTQANQLIFLTKVHYQSPTCLDFIITLPPDFVEENIDDSHTLLIAFLNNLNSRVSDIENKIGFRPSRDNIGDCGTVSGQRIDFICTPDCQNRRKGIRYRVMVFMDGSVYKGYSHQAREMFKHLVETTWQETQLSSNIALCGHAHFLQPAFEYSFLDDARRNSFMGRVMSMCTVPRTLRAEIIHVFCASRPTDITLNRI